MSNTLQDKLDNLLSNYKSNYRTVSDNLINDPLYDKYEPLSFDDICKKFKSPDGLVIKKDEIYFIEFKDIPCYKKDFKDENIYEKIRMSIILKLYDGLLYMDDFLFKNNLITNKTDIFKFKINYIVVFSYDKSNNNMINSRHRARSNKHIHFNLERYKQILIPEIITIDDSAFKSHYINQIH